MQIKFNDTERTYNISLFRHIGNSLVILNGSDLPDENTSGFQTLHNNEVIGDYSAFTVKYNVLTPIEGTLMLSNNKEFVETEENPVSLFLPRPITQEETEEIFQQSKDVKIQESKNKLSEYLSTHPLISTVHRGKEGAYLVTQEKQSLMMSQYMTYQVEKAVNPDAKLTWNETGEECEEWTEAEFLRV